jgi:hypothetical protein
MPTSSVVKLILLCLWWRRRRGRVILEGRPQISLVELGLKQVWGLCLLFFAFMVIGGYKWTYLLR